MIRIKSKKGFEEPRTITYVLITCVIAIIGFMVLAILIADFELRTDFQTRSLRHSLLAARIINSDSCLAYDDGTYVFPGMIDMSKAVDGQTILDRCIKGANYYVKISNLDGVMLAQIGDSSNVAIDWPADVYLVQIKEERGVVSQGMIEIHTYTSEQE